MKRASVLVIAVLFVFSVPMAYGGGTFNTTVIKNSTVAPHGSYTGTDCIVFNNFVGSGWETDHDAYAIQYSDPYYWTDSPYNGNPNYYPLWRRELMQSFMPTSDANMGGFEVKLRDNNQYYQYGPDPELQGVGTNPIGPGTGGRLFTLRLYRMQDSWDRVPDDKDLLMQWTSKLPTGIDSNDLNTTDPNKGNHGDWLKFTFNTGYHLQKNRYYAVRLNFAAPQTDGTRTGIWLFNDYLQPQADEPDQYGLLGHGSYFPGELAAYYPQNIDNTYNPNYWKPTDMDLNFGVVKAAAGQPVAYGKQKGDADFDGKVTMSDFAAIGSNWRVNAPRTDPNIPYVLDDDPITTAIGVNVITLNDFASPADANTAPYTDWTRRTFISSDDDGLHQVGQSFKAQSTTTMKGVSIRLSTAVWPASFDTGGDYQVKVYNVPDFNTPPSGTPIATFKGHIGESAEIASDLPYLNAASNNYEQLYMNLARRVHQREWMTFILPGGVNLTANNYYAFTLEWMHDTDPVIVAGYPRQEYSLRTFYLDTTDPDGSDTYTDGTAFFQDRDEFGATSPYWPLGNGKVDLVFAILGDISVCTNNHPEGFRVLGGDLSGDCKVDFKDVNVLMQNWLVSSVH